MGWNYSFTLLVRWMDSSYWWRPAKFSPFRCFSGFLPTPRVPRWFLLVTLVNLCFPLVSLSLLFPDQALPFFRSSSSQNLFPFYFSFSLTPQTLSSCSVFTSLSPTPPFPLGCSYMFYTPPCSPKKISPAAVVSPCLLYDQLGALKPLSFLQ